MTATDDRERFLWHALNPIRGELRVCSVRDCPREGVTVERIKVTGDVLGRLFVRCEDHTEQRRLDHLPLSSERRRCPECESDNPRVLGLVGSPGQHKGCDNMWHCQCPPEGSGTDPNMGCPLHGCSCTRGPSYEGPEVDCPVHGDPEQEEARIALADPENWGTCRTRLCLHPTHRTHDGVTQGWIGEDPPPTDPDEVTADIVDDDEDPYQQRYTAHQKRKAGQLEVILAERHSERRFGGPLSLDELQQIDEAARLAPSSCDRHAVHLYPVEDRDEKALLGGLLVGGVGWVHRAPTVFLLWADRTAYKAPGEVAYMPFLDAGVMVQNMWLTATSLGLPAAFVNPNVREKNAAFFQQRFIPDEGIFCGALAVGKPHESRILLEREQGS
ncbi:MAG: nitroreductase family protein [Nocardioidaceae bacterium]